MNKTCSWMATLVILMSAASAAAETVTLEMAVDLTDLPRQLIHARLRIPADDEELVLWYPKWVPGTHAPSGPIQNVAGLRLKTPEGEQVSWRRDEEEPYRFHCKLPEGAHEIIAEIDYICNQPTVNSVGADVQGGPLVGYVNWNTCVLYPDGYTDDEIRLDLEVQFPATWKFATALATQEQQENVVRFKTTTLRTLIDSPLIGGEHLRSIQLDAKSLPPAWLHLASESPTALELDEDVVTKYSNVVNEAGALFRRAPYEKYDFLVTCSDEIGWMGLEHLASSLNGVGERDLIDDEQRQGWVAELLPHEYVHSWCGKFRRPAGMATADFHSPKRTELLWIYEGLTQHLGQVLTVRSGLHDREQYVQDLAMTISSLLAQKGRRWRPLLDTAVVSHQLRARSPSWNNLRRSQDYYSEGALYWLEADAIIREKTAGQRSLDDFCKAFFGLPAEQPVVPYELADVYRALNETAEFDWEGFFQRRVYRPQDELVVEVIPRCGYRLQYSSEPSELLRKYENRRKFAYLTDSVGLTVNAQGQIQTVVPDSVADRAGLGPGAEVIGVNDLKFSLQRMKDAVADSTTRRKITLLLVEGDRFRTVELPYADGHRYLTLVRDEKKPDLLDSILKARAAAGKEGD